MLLRSRCSTSSFFSACRCCSMPAPVVTMQVYDQFLHFSSHNPIYTKVLQHTPPSLCQTLAPLSTFPPTCPPRVQPSVQYRSCVLTASVLQGTAVFALSPLCCCNFSPVASLMCAMRQMALSNGLYLPALFVFPR